MSTKPQQISPKKFVCDICCISCAKKTEWTRHINTKKHKVNETREKGNIVSTDFSCKCGKIYKERSGLWRHSKLCITIIDNNKNDDNNKEQKNEPQQPQPYKLYEKDNYLVEVLIKENSDFKNIILDLVKSNTELQKQMLEVCKHGSGNTTNNINTNNSNNKTFNMQLFLNEQCKDAMNIMDFVNSMTLEFADLENVGKLGYVEGISGIIIKKLNELDVYKRPIHCSDAKREIMYVKDDDVWEKENSTYDKLRKAIKYVTKKNGDLMLPWSQMYPSCMNTSHRLNDTYIQIMSQSMGGKEDFIDSENKIMKKIAKAVLIDKHTQHI